MDLQTLVTTHDHWQEPIKPGAVVLRQFALAEAERLLQTIKLITEQSPFRLMHTPSGKPMSAELSACGGYGWISDRYGYRYTNIDPITRQPWPAMPRAFLAFAQRVAAVAGFDAFVPDACLINRYKVGAKMGLHQDADERDFSAPIVSVSLGIPATFSFGGLQRGDKTIKIPLQHGDVVVWGGESRLCFHGVNRIKPDYHALTGETRINLTFRQSQ